MQQTRRSFRDPVTAVLGFGVGLFFFLASQDIGGSGMFPGTVAAVMMVASVAILVKGILRPTSGAPLSGHEILRMVIAIALTLLYIVGVREVGFLTTSLLFVPGVAYALGLRRHLLILATTLIYVLGVYFFFEVLFNTPLPRDLILRYLSH